MTTLAIDYPRPVGVTQLPTGLGVLRYWPKQGGSRVVVGLGRDEINALNAAQRPFATIYEAPSASWMAGGYGAGQQAGRWLAAQFDASGHTPRAVYLAADDTGLSTTAVNACLDGAASVLGRGVVGLYGFLPQLRAAYAGGHASWWWLTGHYVTPDDFPWIHLYQCQGSQPKEIPTTITVGGQLADVDMIWRPDWGQHNGQGDALMALTDAQQQTLYQHVEDLNTVFGGYYAKRQENEGDAAGHTVGAAIYGIEQATTAPDAGGLGARVDALTAKVDALSTQLAAFLGAGVTLGATGQITVGPVAAGKGA